MLHLFKYLLTAVLLSGLVHSIAQNVCEVCSCDNPINVTTVHCDGRNLSSLTGLLLNSTIETLSLANNSLTFQSGDLAQINNLTSLTTLILSNNPLSTIPELSLPLLMHLQLDNTSLTNATFPASYANCTRLQTLVLSNNKFTKLMATDFLLLTALTNLTLDHVQLTAMESSALKHLSNRLQAISLRSNSLESTEFLPALTNLLEVDLDGNKLQQIPIVLMAPGQTKRLSLRNNEITTVNESSPLFHWAAANRSDIEVYLSNNSFDCCQSRWFLAYLNGLHNLVKDSANLTCALPTAYTGKRLLDLRADLMDCSGNPVHPSHIHISKLAVLVSCLISIVVFIAVVVILTLYRRNRLHFRHRHHYERVQGANVHT